MPFRFIPAGAGNTQQPGGPSHQRPVYPRWRGEHFLLFFNSRNKRGLSPLARGTRGRDESPLGFRRFIPAGAGNTFRWCCPSRKHAVYPRWRGEHFAAAYFLRRYTGLSPLARGTLSV